MPKIMIKCPVREQAVPTGLTTETIKLYSITIRLKLRCPACDQFHKWDCKDAWVTD